MTVISQIARIKRWVGGGGLVGGWEGVGVAGWVGSRRQVKATIKTQTAVVCQVSGTNSHNPQDRPRQ